MFVCRLAIFLMCCSFSRLVCAQVVDDFSDGEFTLTPAWLGDTTQFVVSGGMLQLNSAGSDSSYLSIPFSMISDTLEWRVKVKMSFSPSAYNYARYYLMADNVNLEGPQQGYFLQFGESGSSDAIVLFKQDGWSMTPLCRAKDSAIANSFFVNVRVLRLPGAGWQLFTDYAAGENLVLEASVIDGQFNSPSFIGFKTVYTSSNATKFSLDDVYAGAYIYDTLFPFLETAQLFSDSVVKIRWTEKVDSVSVFTASHFFLDGIGSPIQISRDALDERTFYLKFSSPFLEGVVYHLGIVGVEDLLGNVYSDTLHYSLFNTSTAGISDLIISEIMANPTDAPTLPPFEYVEIYNRSSKIIDITSFALTDPGTLGELPPDTLFPNEYLCYTLQTNLVDFQNAGIARMRGLSNFPSLNNDGDRIQLISSTGTLIDDITYDLSMYRDPLRDDYGWSLERKDVHFPCSDKNNWGASHDPSGGTPGNANSISTIFQDTVSPWPVYAFAMDSLHVEIGFSEFLDTVHSANLSYFEVEENSGVIQSIQFSSDQPSVVLSLNQPLTRGIIYTLLLSSSLHDCAGNNLKRWNQLSFAMADSCVKGDVILNEILFNPYLEGSDFVEIYNKSNKAIDLSRLKIAHADALDGIAKDAVYFSTSQRILLPNRYAVATPIPESVELYYPIPDARPLISCPLPSYNDDEGVVVLMNASLQELDRFHYKDDFHFPLIQDAEGFSLERISAKGNGSDSSNWHSAASNSGGATPCQINSQHYDDANDGFSWLQLSPELFSPDNDGYHDVLGIQCAPPRPGYMVALYVYNEFGYPVRKLTEQELIGKEGSWIWNGLSDEGELQEPGIYVLLMELFHIDGDVKKIKKAFVLARRNN